MLPMHVSEGGGLTDAGLRIAGPPFFHYSLAYVVLGLTGSAAHLDSTPTFLAAH